MESWKLPGVVLKNGFKKAINTPVSEHVETFSRNMKKIPAFVGAVSKSVIRKFIRRD